MLEIMNDHNYLQKINLTICKVWQFVGMLINLESHETFILQQIPEVP